jgi:hypothetical protein
MVCRLHLLWKEGCVGYHCNEFVFDVSVAAYTDKRELRV